MYTAVVLTGESQRKLAQAFPCPLGWTSYCHHMTVSLGSHETSPAAHLPLNSVVDIKIVAFAEDQYVQAVMVQSDLTSTNKIKHITLHVNTKNGGKPRMSNDLTNWSEIPPMELQGILLEAY